ncbi:MAG: tetratricopeptide repeat protein [Acidobacteria bacterium]|nr:tetratricopeptide repeat protein [Acidobacteriota bacterium]
MAFGLGFNKAKVLSTAEKYVAQGKIPAAIEEYRKILEHDKKDLTLLNTVADLYARAGKTDEAVKRFHELAEQCVDAGLVPRAIATYKRITKITPDSVQALMRLGDLYSMQGLLRDARAHYTQAVEAYFKAGEKDKARDVFEKLLMLDMENPQLQVRLAALYAETGKKEEAVATYLGAVERFLDGGQPTEATEALQTVLRLDADNAEARTLLARAQLDQGDAARAIETLQGIPSYTTNKGTLNLLFRAYTALADMAKAREIAEQLFHAHDDFSGHAQIAGEMVASGKLDEAVELFNVAADKLLAEKSSGSLIQGLNSVLACDPSHAGALELMLKAYQSAGNMGEVRDTMEHLAHTYRTRGELDKARELFKELVALEPDNTDHLYLLRQVEAEMGHVTPTAEESLEPAVAMASELSGPVTNLMPAASPEPTATETLSHQEEQVVKNCITEAELFITYKQFARAIEVVEGGLAQIPGNIRLTEQLLALCELARDYAKAAQCCESLAEAYVRLGDGERAARYGEMIVTYRQKAQSSESAVGIPPFEFEVEPGVAASSETTAAAPLTAAQQEPQIQEVDLSMEWASVASGEPSILASDDASLVEEIEFYTQAGLISDAAAALERLEQQSPEHPALAGFRERLGIAPLSTEAVSELPKAAIMQPETAGQFPAFDVGVAEAVEPISYTGLPSVEPAAADFAISVPVAEPELGGFADFLSSTAAASEPEPIFAVTVVPGATIEQEPLAPAIPQFDVSAEAELTPETATSSPIAAEEQPAFALEENLPAGESFAADGFELSLDDALGPQMTTPAMATSTAQDPFAALAGDLEPPFSIPQMPPQGVTAGVSETPEKPPMLSELAAKASPQKVFQDLFAEFKAEMEEPMSAADVETHYNMGVAFKEMALYDEAIGEFQKAHQLAVTSNDYSHVVQCCSLLATCFLEKGLPQLAVKWYQTALDSPGVDVESALALRYEMGSACEIAGDRETALRSFLEVYARNIDYRDVATRIRSLQQSP